MRSEASMIANSLERLENARFLSPGKLQDLYDSQMFVVPTETCITSIGTMRRALLTPFYDSMIAHHGLAERVQAAISNGRTFIEADVRIEVPDVEDADFFVNSAVVRIRSCELPDVIDGQYKLHVAAASYEFYDEPSNPEAIVSAAVKSAGHDTSTYLEDVSGSVAFNDAFAVNDWKPQAPVRTHYDHVRHIADAVCSTQLITGLFK